MSETTTTTTPSVEAEKDTNADANKPSTNEIAAVVKSGVAPVSGVKRSSTKLDLPVEQVKRLCKDAMSKEGLENVNLSKDAVTAFLRSAKIFIHYVTASANEIANSQRRKCITSEDVLSALDEVDLGFLARPLRVYMKEYTAEENMKKAAQKVVKDIAAGKTAK